MANKKQTANEENAGERMSSGGRGTLSGTSASGGTEFGRTTSAQSALNQPKADQPSMGSMQSGSSGTSASQSAGGTGAGTAVARSLYDQAKETAGQAYEIAAEKATTKLEEQKTSLSGGLSSVAQSVRMVGENLRGPEVQEGLSKYTAEYSGKAAEKIEGVANYFEQKSVREMYSDLEDFARRNPLAFIGGAFALGLLAARFFKSDSSRHMAAGAAFAGEGAERSGRGPESGITYR